MDFAAHVTQQARRENFASVICMKSSKHVHKKVDAVGACLSFACAVHCLVVPLAIAVLPLLGLEILVHRSFDLFMLTLTALIATLSFIWGARVHKNHRVFLFLAAALTLFSAGEFAVHGMKHAVLVALGGCFLAWGHLINRRLTAHSHAEQDCRCCE